MEFTTKNFDKSIFDQVVFFINWSSPMENSTIEKTTLHDFILESQEETTSPRGVEPREFIDTIHIPSKFDEDEKIWVEDKTDYLPISEILKQQDELFTISSWGYSGNKYHQGTEYYLNKENAELALLQLVYDKYFLNDDQRDTQYYDTEEEAQTELMERIADHYDRPIDVMKRYIEKKKCIENLREERRLNQYKKEKERVQLLSDAYANLIEPKKEKYGDTCVRLSQVLNKKIETKIFHTAVKKIRAKYQP